MRAADAAGDTDAAARIAQVANGLKPEPKSLGKQAWELLVGDDDDTTQNFGEKVGTLLNMGGEAMTAGLIGDEASGVAAGIGAAIVPGGKGFQEAYEGRRDFERQQQELTETTNPGASLTAQIGGAMLPAAVGIGTGALTLGRAVVTGAGYGGTTGVMEGEGAGNRAAAGAFGTLLGGAGGAASIPLGKVVQWAGKNLGQAAARVFGNKQFYVNGTLTQAGRETLESLGYNVDDLSAAFTREFQKNVDNAMAPAEAGRAAGLAEFGIPAFRANVSGSVDDFAALEAARRGGAYSPATQERVRSALTVQDDAMRQAADDIAVNLGGRATPADQFDAASGVMSGLRTARDTARAAAGEAYDALDASGGGIRGEGLANFGQNIKRILETSDSPVRLSPTVTPNAVDAINILDDTFRAANRGSVPFMSIERARQDLVRNRAAAFRGSNGGDQRAMTRVLEAFDQRVDDMMTVAMTEGDAATLDAAKKARGLWSSYKGTFEGDGAASRFIQKLVDIDASPDDAVKWLFSSGKLGTGNFNSTLAKGLKEVLGESSDEWSMMRQAAFRQLTQKPEGTTQLGPQALSSRINEFLNSPATRALSRELYTNQEIATMRRYAGALKSLTPPPGAVNFSNTGYEIARNARSVLRGMGIIAGGAAGGPVGSAAGTLAVSGAQKGSDWLAGRALLQAAPSRAVPQVAARAGGVIGGQTGVAAEEASRPYNPLRLGIPLPGN
ncbi:MAG: hypothetical protein ACU0CT_03555 [Paracoccaceae bacterium]